MLARSNVTWKSFHFENSVLSFKNYVIENCLTITLALLVLNCILSFLPPFIYPSSNEEVENRLWSDYYFDLVQISIWVTVPMLIDFILDYRKNWKDVKKRYILTSRALLVASLIIPGVVQLNLPYRSNPIFAWDALQSIMLTQSALIIGSLLISMYRYKEVITKNTAGHYNIIRGSIRSLVSFLIIKIIQVFQRGIPSVQMSIVLGVFVGLATIHALYVIMRQIRRILMETEDYRFTSPQALSDFLHVITLLVYLLASMFYVFIELRSGKPVSRIVSVLLVSRFKNLSQIFYTVILMVIPVRVNLFHAQLESEKLLRKLNTIRYVSHEMRTPLNTVFLGLQCMEQQLDECENSLHTNNSNLVKVSPAPLEADGKPTATTEQQVSEMQQTVKELQRGCDVVLATLNDLLTADKLEDDKLSLDVTFLEPWEFVQDVTSSFILLARDKKIRYEVLCKDEETKWYRRIKLIGDHFKLSQVMRNFISNALKFTPAEGLVQVTLELVTATVEIDVGETVEREWLQLSVKDSGAGISPENQDKLFGQYVQFNAAQLQKGNGSGLGLWISKKIIELHGGAIGAHSEGVGTGSTFYFQLPLPYTDNSSKEAKPPKELIQGTIASPRMVPHSLSRSGTVSSEFRKGGLPFLSLAQHGMTYFGRSASSKSRKTYEFQSTLDMDVDLESGSCRVESGVRSPNLMLSPRLTKALSSKVAPIEETSELDSSIQKQFTGKRKQWEEGMRVLVVDDSALNRKLSIRLLKAAGHEVDELTDGQEFVDSLPDLKINDISEIKEEIDGLCAEYDVVLMDDSMPGMCGPDATKKARELGYKGLIIGVTGNAFEDQIQRYVSCGADAVLQKPLNLNLLRSQLEEL